MTEKRDIDKYIHISNYYNIIDYIYIYEMIILFWKKDIYSYYNIIAHIYIK